MLIFWTGPNSKQRSQQLNVGHVEFVGFDRVKNTVGKGESAVYQHFLLFPHYVSKTVFVRVMKTLFYVVKG